jgi:hypothetical protein
MVEVRVTKNRILGLIGVIWGGGIVLTRLASSVPASADPGYAAGQNAALLLGTLLAFAGLYYAVKG